MRDLTFICAYFENAGMLREQQAYWRSYPADLRARLHVIVTDDCSPEDQRALPAFESVDLASYRLFRATEKKRWNWLFGRNLGVQQATTDWVLLTDIDHVLHVDTLRALLSGGDLTGELELELSPKGATRRITMPLDPRFIFRFSRVDAHTRLPWPHGSLTRYKEHPNSWLMTRAMFDQMGGYDERFSGFYGSDSDFRERCKMIPDNAGTTPARGVVRLDLPLVRYPREVIPDASTTTFERKAKIDGRNVPRIRDARARIGHWRPLRVTLPYVLEASC